MSAATAPSLPMGRSNTTKKNERKENLNRAILSQRITSILDDIQRLQSALYAMNTTDIQRYPENYELLSTDAALRAEQITCRLRHLIYATTRIKKSEYLTSAAAMQGIDIQQRDGVMEITLPSLLPKRKRGQSSEFLLDTFNTAMEQYVKNNPLPHYRNCVICFTLVYCKDLPDRRVKDYDNLELKQLLDVAASYLLEDDGGLLCDAYQTTELGESDCTRISIMDSWTFPEWLEKQHAALQSIKDL